MTISEISDYIGKRHNSLSNEEFEYIVKNPVIVGYDYKSYEGLNGMHYIWADDGTTWELVVYQENEKEMVKPFRR